MSVAQLGLARGQLGLTRDQLGLAKGQLELARGQLDWSEASSSLLQELDKDSPRQGAASF